MKFWAAGYDDQKSPAAEYPEDRPSTEIFESIFGRKKPASPRRVRFDKFVIRKDSFEKEQVDGNSAQQAPNSSSPRTPPHHSPVAVSENGSPVSPPPMLPSLQMARPTRMYSEFPQRPSIPLRSGSKHEDIRVEPYNRAAAMEEGKHLEHIERVAKRRFWAVVCIAVLLMIGIILAVTLPKVRDAEETTHNLTRKRSKAPGTAVPTPSKPVNTRARAKSKHQCIARLTELYKAVDTYLVDPTNSSRVARTYGHPIGSWCFNETLTDMTAVFSAHRNELAATFNENLSEWDVSYVKNMGSLFYGAASFNQPLPWNVSRVYNMANMFRGATSFNSDISTWDVSNVMVFERIFQNAVSFNVDISTWNLSSALTTRSMFKGATSLRRNLCSFGATLNKIADVSKMFADTPKCKITSPDAPVLSASSYGPFCFPCA
ncbi:hypothetical protein MPSEU_000252400 [Mayamaea pseudoterrestris]|nr:hypothetical protein MPSEU_000252400 [Mayamaea pseudoterrestris]